MCPRDLQGGWLPETPTLHICPILERCREPRPVVYYYELRVWKDGGVRFGELSLVIRVLSFTSFVTLARYLTFLCLILLFCRRG